ncbi:APG6-domain-containing protein [Xylona heveae TC161]|uniref:APG6-domain-containing protein n=1 Tax=Xylona heveae (strain CBS 132557 / TC161) TaxID=1328760 RepID=A0A165JDW3_XYLHT|nr:APG6-domain-containing protein [Xylona heveae TC161]KZF26110.1 APG6-domain-containing protein [Xylona heveae TC161]
MYCQKCRTPLKLDASLEGLNPASFDLLVGSTGVSLQQHPKPLLIQRPNLPQERRDLYEKVSRHSPTPISKRTIPAPRHPQNGQGVPPELSRAGSRDNSAMSFVMLTESQLAPSSASGKPYVDPRGGRVAAQRWHSGSVLEGESTDKDSFAQRVDMTTRLFEILSSRSDIDHPICVECTEIVVDGLQKRLYNANKERDAYVDFLKKVNADIPTDEERQKAVEDLESMRAQEEAVYQELQQLEQEKMTVDEEIAALEEEARQLDLEEEQFWRDRNAFALTLSDFQNERDGLNLQYDHDSRQLERLQRTNVYNDTFCIGHDGYFGTINGLRLGRLANPPVEWTEINAAWGQTLLLLQTVAEKLGFAFEGYRLRPMGSTSRIERIEYPQSASTGGNPSAAPTPKIAILELFSSGDLPLGRMFLHRRFDNAMVAFLECLRQLGDFVEHEPAQSGRSGHGLRLPYEIKKDRIGDASIKLGFNQDEAWTRACKYTLTCCKFLLAHASNVGSSGRRSL